MSKRTLSLLMALALTGSLVAGCGGTQGQTGGDTGSSQGGSASGSVIQLEFWNGFTGPDGEGMQKLVDQFNAEHKGQIQVKMQRIPWAEYYDKIVTAVASGKAPDVGIMHLDHVKRYAKRGVILPLDEDIQALGLSAEDYFPAGWEAGQLDGHQYSIPLDFHPLALYYNIDLLKQAGYDRPPETPEEFVEMAKAATDPSKDQWGFMLQVGWPTQMIFASAIHQFGGSLYTPDGQQAAYNSPEGVAAFQFLYDLVYKHKVSPPNVPVDGGVTAFRQGKLLFHIDGIWMMQGFKEQQGLNFGVAPVSSLFGTKQKAAWGGSHQFVLFKKKDWTAERRQAALTFIDWIGQHSVEWAKWGQIPARNVARESEEFKALKEQSILATQLEHAIFFAAPNNPWAAQGTDPLGDAISAVLTNKMGIKEALDQAVALGNKNMEASRQQEGN
ncbi:MAG: ABC transporter substrate-binding protein [Firmicutes bacterium]|nr:ABC transporter substrate-binding protein [Bacillota bacterium]